MDLRDYMRLVRKRWRIITACVLLALVGAAALTALSPKTYSAQAQVFVSAQASADDLTSALQGSGYTQQRVKSYADIVDTPLVTDSVVKSLSLQISSEDLARKISASNPLDTLLLNISVTDHDPDQAAAMANAVADAVHGGHQGPRDAGGRATGAGQGVRRQARGRSYRPGLAAAEDQLGARPARRPGAGHRPRRAARVAGHQHQEHRRPAEDPQQCRSSASSPRTTMRAPTRSSARTRATCGRRRTDRSGTNLQFIDVERSVKSVVITSAIPDEGKSTTACNLAIAFARTGARVLLVEADLRRPRTADYLGIEGAVGLTNVLLGQVPVGDVLQTWGTLPLRSCRAARSRRTRPSCWARLR